MTCGHSLVYAAYLRRVYSRAQSNCKNHDLVELHIGHLSRGAYIGTHVRASQDPYEATCPTCRAPSVRWTSTSLIRITDGTSHFRHVLDTKEISRLYFTLH